MKDNPEKTPVRSERRRLTATLGRALVVALVVALLVELVVVSLGALQAYGQPASAPAAAHTMRAASATTPSTSTHRSAIPTSTSALLTSDTCPLTADAVAAETFLLNLLNQHRADAHVAPLTLNQRLTAVSHAHSCDMFHRQRLDHLGSDGSTPQQRIATLGGTMRNWGENIGTADGYGPDGGIARIDADMMAEPLTSYDHHYNIVNRAFTQVGLGIIYANGQVWFTEDFLG